METVKDRALKIITQRKLLAELNAKENFANAMKNEEFKSAYKEYTASMINDAKNGKLSENTKKLQKNVEKIAKKLNFGEIYPNYSCDKCGDSGFVNGKMCECLKKEINDILIQESGFGKLNNFGSIDFNIFENSDYMKKVYAKMREWANSDFKKNIVLLSGGTGTGKTYLMTCMANEIIERGKLVKLVSAYRLSQDCLKSYASRSEEEKEALLEGYLNCEVLFIDDLGTEVNHSAITVNYLYTIINERKMKGLPTVITTNLSLADIRDHYDERIYSRIASEESIRLELAGRDLRLKK